MISKDEVIHIAKLARLQLSEPEIEKMQKDLSSILDYFDVLKKAPAVVKAKADKAKVAIKNDLRKDVVMESPASVANNLIAQGIPKEKIATVETLGIIFDEGGVNEVKIELVVSTEYKNLITTNVTITA